MKNLKKLLSMILVLAMLVADFGLAQEMLVADSGDLSAVEELLADSGLELTGEIIEEDGEVTFVVEQAEAEEVPAAEEVALEELPVEELPVEEEVSEEDADILEEVVPEEEASEEAASEEEAPAEETEEEEEIIDEIVIDQMYAAPTYCEGCGQYNTFTADPVYNDEHHWYVCQECWFAASFEEHYSSCTEGNIEQCDVCDADTWNGFVVNITHVPDGETRVNDEEHWDVCELCNFGINVERHWVYCNDETPDACEGCGYKYASGYELHHSTLDHENPFGTAAGHGYLCLYCGELGTELEDHVVDCAYDPDHCVMCGWEANDSMERWHGEVVRKADATHHIWHCNGCGEDYSKEEHYTYCDAPDPSVCAFCEEEGIEYEGSITCEVYHLFDDSTMRSDATHHWYECSGCGEADIKWEHYSFCDNANVCAECGYYNKNGIGYAEHDYDWDNCIPLSDKLHAYYCRICGAEEVSSHGVPCTDADKTVCAACGAACTNPDTWHGETEYFCTPAYHQAKCLECGENAFTETHFVTCQNPTYCWDCGYEDVQYAGYVSHDWVCTKKDSKTHIESCRNCDYSGEYKHIASCRNPGKCASCGYVGSMETSGHYVYDVQWDADQHWYAGCYNCKATNLYKYDHYAACYAPNKCAECGATADEVNNLSIYHEYDSNGVCVFCGEVRQGIARIIMPEKITLGVGEKATLDVHVDPVGAEGTISYALSSSNATLNKDTLLVTAKKVSNVEITATADSGATATTIVEILKAPTKVTMSSTKLTLGVGDSYALSAALPANSASKLTWSSSAPSIVAVDEDGVLTVGENAGKATITVKTFNGKKATCAVTVVEGPDTISISHPTTMSVGQTIDLKVVLKNGATAITSTNTAISCEPAGAVEIDGTSVKLLEEGEATIIATAYNGFKGKAYLNVQPAPDKLYLDDMNTSEWGITLGVGEKMSFNPVIANGSVFDIEFINENEAAATVSGDASKFTVTGKKAGESTTIIVKPHMGEAATIHVSVEKAPSKVTLSAKKLTLGKGETATLNATFPAGSHSNLTWKSSKPGIVAVDEYGNLKAMAEKGSATITATTFNGKKATCTVTVKKAPESLTLTSSLEDNIFSVGQTADLKVALSSGSAGSYWFDVDPASTGAVAFDGNTVIAEQAGEVKIIATAYNEVAGELTLTVQPAPDQAILDAEGAIETEITLGVGEKFTLKPATLNGSKADFSYEIVEGSSKIATVSAAGLITAKKAGTMAIAVKPHTGEAAMVKVNVVAAPTSVSLSAKKLTLGVNEITQLVATLKKDGASSALTWKSSKPGVVAVDTEGNLKALKAGSSTITVTTFNKKKATCTVTVLAEPTALDLSVAADVISIGQTTKLTAAFEPAKCATNATYTLSAEGIVELSGATVTPVAPGEVTITASTYNGLSDSVTITVMEAPDQLVLADETITLGVGEKYELKPTAANGSPVTLKYKAKSTKVATVSADGLVTGKKAGSTTITVTPHVGDPVVVNVAVQAAPKSITLSDAELKMNIGEEYTLTATLPAKTTSKITWSSSDEEVVKVDANGKLTAMGEGTATITAKTFNGKTAKCAVAVEGLPQAQNFTAEYVGEGAVELSWEAVENADGYQLMLYEDGAWNVIEETYRRNATVYGLEAGRYQFGVRAYTFKDDAVSYGKNATANVVVADPMEIIDLYASEYSVQPGTAVSWTLEVEGGLPPFTYHYDLYRNGDHTVCAEEQKSNVFEWTLEKEGSYTIAASVTDDLGNTQKWIGDFSVDVTVGNFWGHEEDDGFVIEGADGVSGEMKLPNMLNGMPVVGICDGAFQGRDDITSVVIPDSVTRIGWGAFQDSALESVTLPASLNEICGGAFANTRLTEVEIPNGTVVLQEAVFADCGSLEVVTIPASVTDFGPDVFANSNRVKLKVAAGSAAEDYAKEYGICYDNGNGYSLHIFGVDYNGEAYGVGETGSWSVEAFGGSGNYKFGFILERNGEAIVETDWIDDCEFAYTFETSGRYMLQAWVNDGESIYHRGCDYAVVISSYDDSGFRYADRGDGNLMLTGVNPEAVDENGVVTLPAEINGIPVINVAEGVFGGCDYINTLIIPEGYEVIESAAFVNSSVESVQLPGTLKRIEDYAFGNADGLEYISVPDSVDYLGQSAFEGCDVLETVVIPASLGEIRNWTFAGCESLVTVEYRYNNDSERISVIGDGAFEDCRNLSNIGVGSLVSIGNRAFAYCCSLDDIWLTSVQYIGENAFECCCSMEMFGIGENLVEMGSRAFQGCNALRELTIPGSLKRVSEWAFEDCGLLELTLEEGVETIADNAFINNYSLRQLNLPASLKFIGNCAFENSHNLGEVDFTALKNTEFGDGAFCNSGITMIVAKDTEAYNYAVDNDIRRIVIGEMDSEALFYHLVWEWNDEQQCDVPVGAMVTGYNWNAGEPEGTLVIPAFVNIDGEDYPVIRVEESAITDTWNLNEVVLPDTIKSMGQWAFANNRGLRKVTLPEGLETIECDVFNGCENLEEVTIPESCTFLGGGAFAGCSNLRKLTILSKDADFDDGHLVDGSEKVVIYCYSGSTAEQFCKGEWGEGYPEFVPYTLLDGDMEYFGVMGIDVYKYADSIGDIAIWKVDAVGQEGNREFHFSLNRNFEHYWASGWTTSDRVSFAFEEDGDYQMTVAMRIAGDPDSETEYFFDDEILSIGQHAADSPFRYMFDGEGVRILGYDDGMPEHMNIPAELEVEVDGEIVALPVVTIGAYAFCDQWNLRSVSIPETVETIMAGAFCRTGLQSVEIPDTVRVLDYEAFAECGDLVSVTLGSGLMEVPMRAFVDCHGLESVTLSEGLEFIGENAFECCCSLYEIKLPETLKAIGGRAFARSGLASLAIPDSVVEIQWEAFCENYELGTVELGSGLRGLQSCAFMNCENLRSINLEDTQLKLLGGGAFENCRSLESIVVPGTVEEMGHRVFTGCNSLQSAVLGNGITDTMWATFEDCHSLRSVTLPDTLEVIGNWCFKNCHSLSDIEIPDGVHTICEYAFESCHSMESLYIPTSVENFGVEVFCDNGCKLYVEIGSAAHAYAEEWGLNYVPLGEADQTRLCYEITDEGVEITDYDGNVEGDLIIPDEIEGKPVVAIRWDALSWQERMTSVSIPDSVYIIDGFAFQGCVNMMSVKLPAGLVTIQENAFNECHSLTKIEVPEGTEYIAYNAFCNCPLLEEVHIPASVTEMDVSLIENSHRCVLFVKPGSYAESYAIDNKLTYNNGTVTPFKVMEVKVDKWTDVVGDNAEWSAFIVGGEDGMKYNYRLYKNGELFKDFGWSTASTVSYTFIDGGDYAMELAVRKANGETSAYTMGYETIIVGLEDEEGLYRYSYVGENEIKITSVTNCEGEIVVPDTIAGATVVGIAEGTFANHGELESIILPASLRFIDKHAFSDNFGLRNVSFAEGCELEEIGEAAFINCHNLEGIEFPAGLKVIEDGAFEECHGFESITLPAGITEISDCAFRCCYNLKTVELPAKLEVLGSNAFAYTAIENITLPDTLEIIKDQVFVDAPLKSIVIPDGVKSIGYEAFAGCRSLEIVELGAGLTSIESCAFMDCGNLRSINLEDTKLEVLGGGVFENCHSLTSVVIPNTVVEMGHRVFLNCHSLESAVLGSGITNTMYATFEECHSLRSVTLPANLEVIDNWCFKNCYSLPAIEIPESVHTLGDNAFESCHNMDGLYIPESVENFGEDVFCNNGSELFVKIDSNAYYYVMDWGYNYVPVGEADQGPLCYEVTEEGIEITGYDGGVEGDLIIPDEIDGMPVVSIGWNAFDGQDHMTSIAIPGSVYNIGGYAFQGCANIRSLDLPESLESIEEAAFNDCRKLTVVEIPDGVEYIGYNVFANCERLEEVHIPASVTQFEDRLLEGSRRCVLFVQPGSDAEAYAIEKNLPYNNGTVAPFMVMEVRVDKWTDVVGDNAEWSAFVVGGESGMKYNYRLYKNGEMFKDFGWKAESTLSYEFTEDGDYTMELAVRKASGKVSDYTMGHETIIIGMEDEEGLFRYSYVGENEIKITSVTNCEGAFEVPETINGATVVGIAEHCFNGRGELESITLPSTLRFIDAHAFSNCYFLYDVNLGENSNLEEIGEYAFFECHSLSNVELPSKVEEIGMGVFENCYSLESVKLPAGITEISECAFRADGCLTEISLPAGLKVIKSNAFAYTALEEITLPESLEWIEDQVFMETPLKSIVIPDKVECIGYEAFVRCGDLEEVQLGSGLRALMSCAFMDCHSLQSINLEDTQLELLGGGVFECCCSLKSVVIPDTVVEMGHRAFLACTSLESAVMGNGMTETMWATFEDCHSLQTVTLPKNVEEIGQWCFKNCHSLNNLAIPASLKSIGEFAFEGAFNLGELTLPDDFDGFGEGCFDDSGVILLVKLDTPAYHYAQEWGLNYRLEGMEVDTSPLVFELWEGEVEGNYFAVLCGYDGEPIGDLVIPSTYEQDGETFTVAGINSGALVDGTNLMSVTIPATVQFIGDSAFANCWRMHTVNFEEGSKLEEIGAEAFANCQQLSSINLEACDNLEIIYDRVFADCYSLGNLAIPASVKEIGGDLVDNNPYTILHVTRGSVGEEYAIENGYAYDNGSGVALTVQELVVDQHAGIGETAVWSTRWVGGSGSVSFTYNLYLGGEAYKKPLVKDTEEDWVEFEFTENGVYMMEVVAKDNKTGKTFSKFANEEVIVSDYDEASGFTYAIEDAEEKNLVITGCGDELAGDVVIPSKLTIDGTAYNVVAILGGAFAGRGSIESVVVSEGIERIDNECFADMFGLRSVELPGTLGEIRPHTFANCINLESVTIANGPESIGESAFDRCGSLTEIKLPESLKVIEGWAFKDCDLKSVVIPDGVEEILWDAFYANKNLETVQLGSGLRVLEACVFMECESLREINLQDTSLEMLGGSVFENCFSLQSIVMPDSIGDMGHRVFFNCSSLESAVMSNGLTNTMWATFENCVNLKSVTLPENLEVIGQWCFNNCSSLEKLAVPESVNTIEGTPEEGFAFAGTAEGFKLIIKAGSYAHEYAVEFGIPYASETMVSGEFTYSYNADFTGVVIKAYSGSDASVTVPETFDNLPVVEIGDNAFEDNASLTTIDLPDSVEVIGVRAFANCTSLASMI